MILARKIVTLSKAELDGHSFAFGIPYKFYVGTHNENPDSVEQKRVFDFLGEDLGVGFWLNPDGVGRWQGPMRHERDGSTNDKALVILRNVSWNWKHGPAITVCHVMDSPFRPHRQTQSPCAIEFSSPDLATPTAPPSSTSFQPTEYKTY